MHIESRRKWWKDGTWDWEGREGRWCARKDSKPLLNANEPKGSAESARSRRVCNAWGGQPMAPRLLLARAIPSSLEGPKGRDAGVWVPFNWFLASRRRLSRSAISSSRDCRWSLLVVIECSEVSSDQSGQPSSWRARVDAKLRLIRCRWQHPSPRCRIESPGPPREIEEQKAHVLLFESFIDRTDVLQCTLWQSIRMSLSPMTPIDDRKS